MTPGDIARHLLALGLSVIPVPRPGPGFDGKTPVIPWKRYQSRLPPLATLEGWFRGTPQNLAVVTGQLSGVVVVDVDAGAAWRWVQTHLPDTPWKTRTAKGVHLWYQHPGGHVPNRSRPLLDDGKLPLDIRADGGFVIVPNSVHASGAVYRFAGNWKALKRDLPVFSPEWLRPPVVPERVANQERRSASLASVDPLRRARAYLAAVPRPEIGCGSDHATFTAACRLVRGFALSSTDAADLLWDWCGHRAGWTREWVEHKVSNARDHGTEQMGALL